MTRPSMLHAVNWWSSNRPGQRWEVFVPDEEENAEGVDLLDGRGGTLAEDVDEDAAYIAQFAPEMAEYIHRQHVARKDLRPVYAVQVDNRGFLRMDDEGKFALTNDPLRAFQHCHPGVSAQIAETASAKFQCECRVIRRLTTDWEVVE